MSAQNDFVVLKLPTKMVDQIAILLSEFPHKIVNPILTTIDAQANNPDIQALGASPPANSVAP